MVMQGLSALGEVGGVTTEAHMQRDKQATLERVRSWPQE
jgi:hypothetical protein